MRLKDKVAIVTGASRGIGKAIALAYAREGADVVVAARTETENPDLPGTIYKTAKEIQRLGRRSLPLKTDVGDEQSVEEMVQSTLKEFGRVDILVNNAATNYYCPFLEFSVKRWDLVIRINLRATFLCSKAVMPKMVEQRGGNIINFSSCVVRYPEQNIPDIAIAYAAAKAGIERLTLGLAREMKEHNIAVNVFVPDRTTTEGMKFWKPDVDMSDWQTPEQWGRYAVFVGAQNAQTLTGKILPASEIEEEAIRLGWTL